MFQNGCVIKFKRNAYLLMYGAVSFPASGARCVFTSKDDDEYGDSIDRVDPSTGCPSQAASQAIWLYYETQSTTVRNVLVRWAQRGVQEDENSGVHDYPYISSAAFENCGVGVYINLPSDTLTLSGDTTCNVTTPIAGSGYYSGSFSPVCSSVSADFSITGGAVHAAGTAINFVDHSQGSTVSRTWYFGDGTSSTTTSTHTYNNPGRYTVTLTVYGAIPNNSSSKSLSHTVYGTADFSTSQAQPSMTVTFTDTSQLTPASRYTWDFGDGTILYGDNNSYSTSSHTYSTFGTFTATMTAYYCDPFNCQSASSTHTFTVYPAVVNVSNMQYSEAEPAIAVNPNNPQSIAVFSMKAGAPSPGTAGLMQAVSTDGGQTWPIRKKIACMSVDAQCGLGCESTSTCGDGLPPADGGDVSAVYDGFGNLFLAYMKGAYCPSGGMQVVVARSTNNGATWTRVDNGNLNSINGGTLDQPWLAIGPSGASAQTLWVCYADGDHNTGNYKIRAAGVSDNAGTLGAWSATQFVQSNNGPFFNSRIAVGPSGKVVCVFQSATARQSGMIYYNLNDGGLGGSWNPQVSVVTAVTASLHDAAIPPQPSRGISNGPMIAWGPSPNGAQYGRAYVAYVDATSTAVNAETDIHVVFADYNSQGMAWTPATNANGQSMLNDDATGNYHFLPAIAADQSASGRVGVGWYDSRIDSTGHQYVQYWGAVSSNGGANFGRNFALTPGNSYATDLVWRTGSDCDNYVSKSYDFLDYTGLAYVGGILYGVWSDNANTPVQNNSNGTGYSDIYMAKGAPPSP